MDVKALIGSAEFKARQLVSTGFADKAGVDNAIVLAVRDAYQREGIGFFPDVEHTARSTRTKNSTSTSSWQKPRAVRS